MPLQAHELRNPVAPIAIAGEALGRLVGEDNRNRALIDVIHRQATHLGRLLDDPLDVARITRGRIDLRCESLTLASCIEQALETAQPLIRARAHCLTLTQTPAPLYFHGDRVRLAQCVANVLILQ